MEFENPLTFVRSLKGAPASILLAFVFSRRAMTALELQEWTGYKGDNITVAVRLLINLGWLIARSPRGPWCLAEGRQFPLISDESDLIGFVSSVVAAAESNEKVSTITATTTTTDRSTPIKSDSQSEEDEKTFAFKENIATFRELKIVGRRPQKVAALEWVTPDYIRAHVAAARDKPGIDNPEGFALTRMEDQAPMPEKELTSRHAETTKYTGGAFAELLEHNEYDDDHPEDCRCLDCKRAHPERFCQFRVVHPAERISRSTYRSEWISICDRSLKPGQKYCDEHMQQESEEK